jgi:hypothetical protein
MHWIGESFELARSIGCESDVSELMLQLFISSIATFLRCATESPYILS